MVIGTKLLLMIVHEIRRRSYVLYPSSFFFFCTQRRTWLQIYIENTRYPAA